MRPTRLFHMHTTSTTARARIDAHRLLRKDVPPSSNDEHPIATVALQERENARKRAIRRLFVHLGAFVAAYVFTAGVALLGVLLWVRPDTLLPLVELGLLAAVVFVVVFSALRVVVLHHIFSDEYPNSEEDPGLEHHVAKSVAYGFVALALALLITGLLINLASAAAPYKLSSNQATSSS